MNGNDLFVGGVACCLGLAFVAAALFNWNWWFEMRKALIPMYVAGRGDKRPGPFNPHDWNTTTLHCETAVLQVLLELQGKRWLSRGQPQHWGGLVPSIDREPLEHRQILIERLRSAEEVPGVPVEHLVDWRQPDGSVRQRLRHAIVKTRADGLQHALIAIDGYQRL